MAKVILHAAYPLWRKNTLVTFARARELMDDGHDVVLTHCAARGGTCACNYSGSAWICRICRSGIEDTARSLNVRTVPLRVPAEPPADRAPLRYNACRELVEGVRSGLISVFRLLAKDVDDSPVLRRVKRRYWKTSTALLKSIEALFDRERPDRVELFNGRHACCKFALLAARGRGLPFNTLEVTARKRPILHRGHTAHDRAGIQARMLSHEADMEHAARVYAARRRPRENRFTRRQAADFVPPDATGFRRKIGVFLSSQDEFESLGRGWKSDFPPDWHGVRRACERYPDFFFTIRFHPNQAGIKSDVTSAFREIEKLPNTRVYYPTDDANTYTLIDWADTVVTFNSTVAPESCWAGKPVIIVGPSFYDRLGVGYTPESEDAFLDLLGRDDLEPGSRESAARLAHYMTHGGDDFRYLTIVDGDMRPVGFNRARGWLAYLARYFEVAWCQVVRWSIPKRDA